jgi:hypothetical protein
VHEFGELLGVINGQQEVEMGGQEDRRMAADRGLSLGSSQDSSDDFVQGRARPQQELGLESPNRHLYKRAPIGYKAHTSGHALYKDEERAVNVISEWTQFAVLTSLSPSATQAGETMTLQDSQSADASVAFQDGGQFKDELKAEGSFSGEGGN